MARKTCKHININLIQMIRTIKFLARTITFILPLIAGASCTPEKTGLPDNNVLESVTQTPERMKDTINIIIGEKHFTAILESNAAAIEFKKMLPLTVSMKDLNSNEKFFDLPMSLPANAADPRTINSGDLMLWASNTLVLFYKTFNTSYSYTRLGRIENPNGIAEALGSGNVMVAFERLSN
jgi:hypothetical protein